MVYLLPGLTAWQRRAVIRRLAPGGEPRIRPRDCRCRSWRSRSASTGYGRRPGSSGRSSRLHPVVTLVPSAFVVAMMALFVIAAGDRPASRSMRGGLADAAAAQRRHGRDGERGTGPRADDRGTRPPSGPAVLPAAEQGLAQGSASRPGRLDGAHSAVKPLTGAHVQLGSWYVCPQAMPAATSRATVSWPAAAGHREPHRYRPPPWPAGLRLVEARRRRRRSGSRTAVEPAAHSAMPAQAETRTAPDAQCDQAG